MYSDSYDVLWNFTPVYDASPYQRKTA